MNDQQRSRRNHPAQIAADERAWNAIVAGYHAGLTAKDPFDTPVTPAVEQDMSSVTIDPHGKITFFHDGQRVALTEDQARTLTGDLTRTLTQIAAERYKAIQ